MSWDVRTMEKSKVGCVVPCLVERVHHHLKERGFTSCRSKSCDTRQFCRAHSEAAINYKKREFIDYKTSMIKDEDPCGDCCSTSISVSHTLVLMVKL